MAQFYLDKLKEARKFYNIARRVYINNPTKDNQIARDLTYGWLKIARKNYQTVKGL